MLADTGWEKSSSPFHAGELAIQDRLGVKEQMDTFGRRIIRAYMPQQHRDFYADLPFVIAGSIDREGWPWASIVFGKAGFITSPDNRTLKLNSTAAPGDPIAENLRKNQPLGFLGIDIATRRRNRVNGRVVSAQTGSLTLSVDHAFGNCPQYIQTRALTYTREPDAANPHPVIEQLHDLNDDARALIASSDTFFVASYAHADGASDVEGVDVSHRGGRPGFVKINGNQLTIPDYAGNNHFNTLGNFAVTPKAGLLFPDFTTGDLLLLTGTVELLWDDTETRHYLGAERAWRFTLEKGVRLIAALPFTAAFGDFSPNSLLTGIWEERAVTLRAEAEKNVWHAFKITKIIEESSNIRSFYMTRQDGGALISHQAGQHLTIRVKPDAKDFETRPYSLSSAPGEPFYRISVKREKSGTVSRHLHDRVRVGDILEAQAPRGSFTFDGRETRPAVLIAGGVGVTPIVSMARHALQEGIRTRRIRQTTIFHSAGTTRERAFFRTFQDLSGASNGALRYYSLITRPDKGEEAGKDFSAQDRFSADILRRTLTLDDYDFYICGPAGFMQTAYDAVRELGVRDARIFAEAFGPSALIRKADAPANQPEDGEADKAVITFQQSGFEQSWIKGDPSLLETAEAHGITPAFGCRTGSCGSCATKLLAGKVSYRGRPTATTREDEALICCAVPAKGTDRLVLDT